eukprot:10827552-Alexandrium_andersonii.AAC.1
MPVVIAADVSACPTQLPVLSNALAEGLLVDVGARASAWGGIDGQCTARAHGSKQPSRIDCFFVSAQAL